MKAAELLLNFFAVRCSNQRSSFTTVRMTMYDLFGSDL